MTSIRWGPEAQDTLDKLEHHVRARILKKLHRDIAKDVLRYIEHLEGVDFGKIRIGSYRLFVDHDRASDELFIRSLRHRHDAYKF